MTCLDDKAKISPVERAVHELHEHICAGNREDAVEILKWLFPKYDLRSVQETRNLFPDRVPL